MRRACALGWAGRPEARAALLALLRSEPAEDVIDAISAVADETALVLLARIARLYTPGALAVDNVGADGLELSANRANATLVGGAHPTQPGNIQTVEENVVGELLWRFRGLHRT